MVILINRPYIKQLAKQRISRNLGSAIAASLLTIAFVLIGLVFFYVGYFTTFFQAMGISASPDVSPEMLISIIAPMLIGYVIFIAYLLFVYSIIFSSCRGWFMRYWRGEDPPVGQVFVGFKRYPSFLCTNLLRAVFTFLWSLLFIIPGIVKRYAYSMADYIVYENPNLPARKVLDMSKKMTKGYKGQLFIFDLSYIGWFLLSELTCGILSIVYVNPYIFTAHAGMYETLKIDAINRGILKWEDFGMMPPPPAPPAPPVNYGAPQNPQM